MRAPRPHLACAPTPSVVAALTARAFAQPPLAVGGFVAAVDIDSLPAPAPAALLQRRRSDYHG